MATSTIPKIEDQTAPFFSINIAALLPNFADKNATIKNLNPREIMQIIKNINILKFISPLVIVKSLKGNGVKPARNKIPSQAEKALLSEDNCCFKFTASFS